MPKDLEKIVIKVGTATLSSSDSNSAININVVENLTNVISKLKESGHKVVLVTSGAVALGIKRLSLSKKPKTILEKQVAAAVG